VSTRRASISAARCSGWTACRISQAEIWLEVVTDDLEGAAAHFEEHACTRRDEIEPLPEGFRAFWISSPANIIHLVSEDTAS